MENMHFAFALHLNERKQCMRLYVLIDEGRTEVYSVLEKVYHASVHIYQHAYDCTLPEQSILGRIYSIFWISTIIISPFLILEFVTRLKIHAPNIVLSRQILINKKVLSTHANADSWTTIKLRWQLINPILEIILAFLFTERQVADLNGPVLILLVSAFLGLYGPT